MNFFKGLFWASVISLCLWVVILSCSYSMIAEVDMRREKVENKAKVYQWWHERAHNEYVTSREWTR